MEYKKNDLLTVTIEDMGHDGEGIGKVDGYTVSITREGVTFVVTNTYVPETPNTPPPTEPGKPDQPSLPQTGQLWWPVPLLLVGGLLLVVIGLIRRRGIADEQK